ncbi:aspartate/glutamate racemase family protein [Stappia sp. BW2]|uniref:aspartate/glutamate racemase family protein n=1 Tax=Stappia sp. BW2 TaxID=2592622 RepID=UPI0011DEE96F|nr:aspartate/glutamate racemase family protein [Stappia sp. BW2]TYC66349.1 aspartate/glutamate racemase family protein [Stappia sp. BW2]
MNKNFLGILSLDTAFVRIRGDVGNPESYPFEARVKIVPGADSPLIVQDGVPAPELIDHFILAARQLEEEGASAIVSTCGFLVTAQATIAKSVGVPVMLSALSMYSTIGAECAGRIGILTASRAALGPRALRAAGIREEDVAIAGLESSTEFERTFLVTRNSQALTLNREEIEKAVVEAAQNLKANNPDLSALLFECGNLPPYAGAVRAATGLPVFHMLDAAALLMGASVSSG